MRLPDRAPHQPALRRAGLLLAGRRHRGAQPSQPPLGNSTALERHVCALTPIPRRWASGTSRLHSSVSHASFGGMSWVAGGVAFFERLGRGFFGVSVISVLQLQGRTLLPTWNRLPVAHEV